MVSIRLQRTGRRRHAQFRVVVQDSRRAPTSGRVIANLGFYNPHTKEHGVDLEKAAVYLQNGAQPSERMVKFFTDHKVDLPAWVVRPGQKSKSVRHPDKLRRNRPPEEAAPAVETGTAEPEGVTEEPAETGDPASEEETQAEEATNEDETETAAEEEEATEEDSGGDEPEEKEAGRQADAK